MQHVHSIHTRRAKRAYVPENSERICLGRSAREDDIITLYFNKPRYSCPRILQLFLRPPPLFVWRRRIPSHPCRSIKIDSSFPKHIFILKQKLQSSYFYDEIEPLWRG